MNETQQGIVHAESKVLSTELEIKQAFSFNLLNHVILIRLRKSTIRNKQKLM